MSAEQKKQMGVLGLIVALMVVLVGSLLFMGAVSGWFDDPKVSLSEEYYTDTPEMMDLSVAGYEELVNNKKSFLVFVDQASCTTADRLRDYVKDYMKTHGVSIYRMMFSEVKESSLHDSVKYYPSVVIINRGMVRDFLRADSDEDSGAYNDYGIFEEWMTQRLE